MQEFLDINLDSFRNPQDPIDYGIKKCGLLHFAEQAFIQMNEVERKIHDKKLAQRLTKELGENPNNSVLQKRLKEINLRMEIREINAGLAKKNPVQEKKKNVFSAEDLYAWQQIKLEIAASNK